MELEECEVCGERALTVSDGIDLCDLCALELIELQGGSFSETRATILIGIDEVLRSMPWPVRPVLLRLWYWNGDRTLGGPVRSRARWLRSRRRSSR